MKKFFIGMSAMAITASMLGTASFADSTLKTVKVDKLNTIGAMDEQQASKIEIKEIKKDDWAENVSFELRLPDGATWNALTTVNGKYKPYIDKNVLKFTLTTNKDYEDSFYITPFVDIDRKTQKGGNLSVNISSNISGDTSETVDIATISNYSVSLSSNYNKVQKNKKINVEFTLNESVENSMISGGLYEIYLNNATIDKDSVKIEQLGGFDTLSLSKVGNDYVELDFKNKLDPKNKWKISMTVTPKKDYVGSIMATFDGRGVDKASTNIADVYDGINFVNRVPDQITLGLQDQAIKTFSLLESMPGSLAKGDYTLRVNPAYKGFSFTSAKVLAKTGNIDVKSLSIDKDNIKFSVKSESTRPSEIEFSNVTASIDRFGYDGTYKLELVNNNDTNSVIASIDLFNVNAATPVTTPTNNALDIKFVIGSKDYTVNKEAKTLDVAPYIAKGNRTMLPVRAVAESLKMNVAWNEADKTITLTKTDNSKKIILTLGSKAMFVDGEKVTLDSAPEIKDSRTFLPVAQIANAVGVDTSWDAKTKTVTLTK